MKLPARQFATALWIAAAILIVAQELIYLVPFYGQHPRPMDARNFLISIVNALVYGGGLAAFGAGIHLLGEIRDLLTRGG
ncbi:MAG TPA: hypothetical protein VMF67_11495 [Rhizomicrobium sp.]|nr:hypothetical protein [Rhizomicrobium sp.]